MAGEVSVQLSEADYVAANRDWFLLHVTGRERLKGLATFTLLLATLAAAIGFFDSREALLGAAAGAGVGAALALVVMGLFYLACFIMVPRQARRLFGQQASLRDPVHYFWSDAGFGYRSDRASADLPWADYYRWAEGRRSFLFFLNEQMFYLVPKHALSPDQAEDLRATAAARGPSGR